jgi:hypothetical protein
MAYSRRSERASGAGVVILCSHIVVRAAHTVLPDLFKRHRALSGELTKCFIVERAGAGHISEARHKT